MRADIKSARTRKVESLGGQILGHPTTHLQVSYGKERAGTDESGTGSLGGLWVVDAEDLPQFNNDGVEPITADELRRIVNKLVVGKAKGVDAWNPAELRALSQSHIQGLASILNK
eukprot:13733674-Heterocapsa_arctica.AAC.1